MPGLSRSWQYVASSNAYWTWQFYKVSGYLLGEIYGLSFMADYGKIEAQYQGMFKSRLAAVAEVPRSWIFVG